MKPFDIYLYDSSFAWVCPIESSEKSFGQTVHSFYISVDTAKTVKLNIASTPRLFGKRNPTNSSFSLLDVTEIEIKNHLLPDLSEFSGLITGYPFNSFIIEIENNESFICDAIRLQKQMICFSSLDYKGDVSRHTYSIPNNFQRIKIKLSQLTKQLPASYLDAALHSYSENLIGRLDGIISKYIWTSLGLKEMNWHNEFCGNRLTNSRINHINVSYNPQTKIINFFTKETLDQTTEGTIRSNSSMDPYDDEWGYITTRNLWCVARMSTSDYSKIQLFLSSNGLIEETNFAWNNTITQIWRLTREVHKMDFLKELNLQIQENVTTSKWRS